MENQTPTPNPIPTPENVPIQNPAVEAPPSQVYTAPHIDNPPPKKSFLTSRIILLIVIFLVLVGLGGTYLTLNSKPKPQPTAPKAAPTPTSTTVDETASWKTYTNLDLGFSIKYPDFMNIYEDEGSVVFFRGVKIELPPDSPVDPYPVPNIGFSKGHGSTAREACEIATAGACHDTSIAGVSRSITEAKINNIDALKVVWSTDPYSPGYYLANPSGTSVLHIGLLTDRRESDNPRSENDKENDLRLLNQILSTFKFIGLTPTASAPRTIFCTQDAKLCPDGSYVGREGPNCEFAPCPGQ